MTCSARYLQTIHLSRLVAMRPPLQIQQALSAMTTTVDRCALGPLRMGKLVTKRTKRRALLEFALCPAIDIDESESFTGISNTKQTHRGRFASIYRPFASQCTIAGIYVLRNQLECWFVAIT